MRLKHLDKLTSLNADNVILRGTKLKNTPKIVGITVYTGHETKIFMNNAKAEYKFSMLDKLTNKSIIVILSV